MGKNRKPRPKSVVFDENSRREFVTGFHKRKLERRKKFEEKLERDLKEAKKRIKAKARETLKKITQLYEESHDLPLFEKHYELPEHTVQVRELSTQDIVRENNWIGENKTRYKHESELEPESMDDTEQSKYEIDPIPGMSLSSIKAVRKVVSKQSAKIMKHDAVFKRKNKIERTKNKKRAAKKKKLLEKEKNKRKGKRRR